MIGDSNSVVGFATNFIGGMVTGTDSFVFIGIILFLLVAVMMIFARVKVGTAVMVGASMAVMLSAVASEFGFIFWIAILVAGFVLVNGIRKWITGQ